MTDFYKYQGTGNDFIIIPDMGDKINIDSKKVSSLCDRNEGIGADGLIIVKPSNKADIYMDFYNSDGSKAEVCGNGLRCLGAYAKDKLEKKDILKVESLAGNKDVIINTDNYIVNMGKPSFNTKDVPVNIEEKEEVVDYPLEVKDKIYNITCISMGNPHVVIYGDEKVLEDAQKYGPIIEIDSHFPNKTNIEFVNMKDGKANVVVWERGVGLTKACGTGACAVLAAAKKLGKVENSLDVYLPGGLLNVKYDNEGNIHLKGPADFEYKGKIDL